MMAVYFSILTLLLLVHHVYSEETITVNPGDDIQSAIDKLHNEYKGGRVIFNKGTYTISKSLLIYSNIVLQGNPSVSNKDIIIQTDPSNLKFNEPLLWNDDKNTSNIAIINLQFLGNIQPSEQKYPACCHSDPSNCTSNPPCNTMRANFNGISMGGGGSTIDTAYNFNYTLRDVIVSKCSMGITMSGWRMVIIRDVELYGNGMIQTYFHNIYLRRNFNISISGLVSHDSPTGNGINISQSSYITAFLNIFYNNYWRGFRIYGEEGYTVYNIDVHNITCNNNSDYGFLFANIVNGVVYDNEASNNKNQNEHDSNCKNVTFTDNKW